MINRESTFVGVRVREYRVGGGGNKGSNKGSRKDRVFKGFVLLRYVFVLLVDIVYIF